MDTHETGFNGSDDDRECYSNELHGPVGDQMFELEFERRQRDHEVAELVGKVALSNYGLLILERRDHQCGDAYEHRYFALRLGKITLTRGGRERKVIVISEDPSTYEFLDCNAEYSYKLPRSSMEFVDGAWVPTNVAHYDY